MYGEWSLRPAAVEQIWASFDQVSVDLFASQENAQYMLFFPLYNADTPLGIDALAHGWPHVLLYASNSSHSVQSERKLSHVDSDTAVQACYALAEGDLSPAARSAVATPAMQRPAVTGRRLSLSESAPTGLPLYERRATASPSVQADGPPVGPCYGTGRAE